MYVQFGILSYYVCILFKSKGNCNRLYLSCYHETAFTTFIKPTDIVKLIIIYSKGSKCRHVSISTANVIDKHINEKKNTKIKIIKNT